MAVQHRSPPPPPAGSAAAPEAKPDANALEPRAPERCQQSFNRRPGSDLSVHRRNLPDAPRTSPAGSLLRDVRQSGGSDGPCGYARVWRQRELERTSRAGAGETPSCAVHCQRNRRAVGAPRRASGSGQTQSRIGITTYRVVKTPGAWTRQLLLESVRPISTRSPSTALKASRR